MTPYLFAHENPHAPRRANRKRFWGYPSRPPGVAPRLIGVHTTESLFDLIGHDTGAEGVAAFQASTRRPSSYHRIVDRDSTVVMLPDDAVAFGIVGLNSPTLHLSFAMRASDWAHPGVARAAVPALERAALVVAEWCEAYRIPLQRIGRATALAGGSGVIAHGDADPARRSDPGSHFPWATFLAMCSELLAEPEDAEVDPMLEILNEPGNKTKYLSNGVTRRPMIGSELARWRAKGVPETEVSREQLAAIVLVRP